MSSPFLGIANHSHGIQHWINTSWCAHRHRYIYIYMCVCVCTHVPRETDQNYSFTRDNDDKTWNFRIPKLLGWLHFDHHRPISWHGKSGKPQDGMIKYAEILELEMTSFLSPYTYMGLSKTGVYHCLKMEYHKWVWVKMPRPNKPTTSVIVRILSSAIKKTAPCSAKKTFCWR